MQEQDSRNYPRRRTLLTGRIIADDGRNSECVCRDLSISGARLSTKGAPFQVGEEVHLHLDRFDELLRGKIVWHRDGQFGLVFGAVMSVIPDSMRELMKPLTR